MTQSEDVAVAWYEYEFGIKLERNGWPDCWGIETDGRPLVIEIKFKDGDLTDQQIFMRNFLIKAGAHYLLIHVNKEYNCKVVFDSDKHKI